VRKICKIMEIGISTATLFGRCFNEKALPVLEGLDARVCEVFLETFSEYTEEYARFLKSKINSLKVHSIHTLNTHFEPQLFTANERALKDALIIFENCLKAGKILGASCYTLHGKARLKKDASFTNYSELGAYFKDATEIAKKYGMFVTLENVEWACYGKPGFFSQVKKYAPNLMGCLDVKQARLSGFDYKQYIEDMGDSIKTVHLSDVDKNGNITIPSKQGCFDFEELFKMLKYNGFNGNCLIEIYKENFKEEGELRDSLNYLREIKQKIFEE